jgi:hypothetical protein
MLTSLPSPSIRGEERDAEEEHPDEEPVTTVERHPCRTTYCCCCCGGGACELRPPTPTADVSCCDAPGFQPELLTLMSRSTLLTLVKRQSTWAITSKTLPTTPNDQHYRQPLTHQCRPELLPRSPYFT